MIGKGDITAQMGKTLKAQEEETHLFLGYRVVGTGLGVPPEENPIRPDPPSPPGVHPESDGHY
jgi:hypothetical protein